MGDLTAVRRTITPATLRRRVSDVNHYFALPADSATATKLQGVPACFRYKCSGLLTSMHNRASCWDVEAQKTRGACKIRVGGSPPNVWHVSRHLLFPHPRGLELPNPRRTSSKVGPTTLYRNDRCKTRGMIQRAAHISFGRFTCSSKRLVAQVSGCVSQLRLPQVSRVLEIDWLPCFGDSNTVRVDCLALDSCSAGHWLPL